MQWSQSVGKSALSGVTGDETDYMVQALSVSESDDLEAALIEFWTKVLTSLPIDAAQPWEILLFDFWLDAGLVTAIFTTKDRTYDHPTVIKLSSDRMLAEYKTLPSPLEDLGGFEDGNSALKQRYWDLLLQAGHSAPIAELLARVRLEQVIPIWGTEYSSEDEMRELAI